MDSVTRRGRLFLSLFHHRPEPRVQRVVLIAGTLVFLALGGCMLAGPQVLAGADRPVAFVNTLPDTDGRIRRAPLHDIGKVGIPDAILLKPGKLTDDEFRIMRRHSSIGQLALERAGRFPGADLRHSFLRFGGQMAGSHHERWDGTGYPQRLRGDAIPMSARLMALADVYDALRSKRSYKDAMSHEEAVACIREASGTQFDPDVVRAFLEIQHVFADIAARHTDDREG